jgi:hypothetical protein
LRKQISLLLLCADPPTDTKKRGGVQEIIYTSGVAGGVRAGLDWTRNLRFSPVIPVC